ncbi:tRNA methyltransferase 10 homolog C [Microcaecilia unicolor]|uniref:tRNA methyltransferase 10 homolog C n=1 Tax=Microcaecilia unicolor TaxID=1415580 RepID=A0A6P7Y003_9AMPH|nr:tRNA methyltransferase 10 homolog C [Microcaecilia unicolor]XP_030060969.1 tRNA methyltransferase 10 homolog C [Microcaecilia unicolor]XP_030060970.1 tRNA methyltransferase 10 homolog C [Microcaecilia unicolor]XP_030060971.1 tRNA methyltransferase 10 homolog C [Microcaecilia unicolor]
MSFFNTLLKKAVKVTVFQPVLPEEARNALFLRAAHKLPPRRTLVLSVGMRKEEIQLVPSEKLDLDEWKNVIKSDLPKEGPEILEHEGDSSLTAIREMVKMWRMAGKIVPENISNEQLKVLMELTTKSSRKKYLKYLATKEHLKNAKKEKQMAKRKIMLEKPIETEEPSEPLNTLFLKFQPRTFACMYNWRAARAMKFGQPLVFDMVYDKYMTNMEIQNTISQLLETEGCNRRSPDPFHIHFCSLQTEGPYQKEFLKRYRETWDKLLVTTTEKAHIEMFPKEKLVYLTADSPNVMKTYEHDKIYIIGSLVDRSIQTGLSLANAKRLNLSTARLPLEKYLHWEIGNKTLTLDQMIRILLTLKDTGDWKKALEFVPKRKHGGFVDTQNYSQEKKELLKKRKVYQFGSSPKNIDKSLSSNLNKEPKPKRWWEEE